MAMICQAERNVVPRTRNSRSPLNSLLSPPPPPYPPSEVVLRGVPQAGHGRRRHRRRGPRRRPTLPLNRSDLMASQAFALFLLKQSGRNRVNSWKHYLDEKNNAPLPYLFSTTFLRFLIMTLSGDNSLHLIFLKQRNTND